jgi:hypothetical protein
MAFKLISLMLAVLLVATPLASAQSFEVQAGIILPDSPLYFLDILFDNLRLFLLQGKMKAIIGLQIAEERVVEMEKMTQQNKFQVIERTMREHQNVVNTIEEAMRRLPDEDKVEIQEKLYKHISVLESVLERVPIQAKQGIQTALENSKRVFDNIQDTIPQDIRESVEEIIDKINRGEISIRRMI